MALLNASQDLRIPTIPFKDIEVATENFTTVIGKGGYGVVYKGELTLSGKPTTVAVKRLHLNISGQGFKEFLTEIQLLSRYKHPNLVSLVGFCEDGPEKILIYAYAENGSLDKYLNNGSDKPTTSSLSWKQRISICIDAARGLDYLHNQVGQNRRIIHRDIKSANILLDNNWKAMISDLGLSKLGRANEKDTYLITNASGTYGYCDPAYMDTGILTKESDVYSFGVVLLEVLCGRLCFLDVDDERRFLSRIAQRWYKNKELYEKIDPEMKNQVKQESFDMFSDIAFRCLQDDRNKRPSMGWVVRQLEEALELQKELQAIRIDFEDIKSATKNFTIVVGQCGHHGMVYRGQLSLSGKDTTVAIWRMVSNGCISEQESKDFFQLLRRRGNHPNLVSPVGFCEEGNESILIYEYPEHGSLRECLDMSESETTSLVLTWRQRVRICIDTARGLEYLLNQNVSADHKVVPRDLKSANIMIYQKMKAKIADFQLYKPSHANESEVDANKNGMVEPSHANENYIDANEADSVEPRHASCWSFLCLHCRSRKKTNHANENGSVEPSHANERDVNENEDDSVSASHDSLYIYERLQAREDIFWSFGTVLFEVLLWKRYVYVRDSKDIQRRYVYHDLHESIDPRLKRQMISESLNRFTKIAYHCLGDERPSIGFVVKKLEEALEFQMATGNYVKVGPWGGEGGYPWIFDVDGRISKILISCGDIVDSITFITMSGDGVENQSDRYGGFGGRIKTITFAEDEDIIEVSGTYGDFYGVILIRSLCFHTNKDTYGPFSDEEGKSFSLPVPKGKFIGFFGRHGGYLDSFGVILQP